MKLTKIIKKEILKESASEGLVDAIFNLQRVTKRIDFKKVREWGKKNNKLAPKLLGMLNNILITLKKLKM